MPLAAPYRHLWSKGYVTRPGVTAVVENVLYYPEQNLILTPEGGKETRRDGPWSPAPLFPKSYFYGDPPAKR